MCFGSRSRPPRIIYQGPSLSDIRAQQEALANYRRQSMEQNRLFSLSIQRQVDAANAQAEDYRARLVQERERAAALNATQLQGAYGVSSKRVPPPPDAETTQLAPVVMGDKRPSLRVGRGVAKKRQGTGLNIGV